MKITIDKKVDPVLVEARVLWVVDEGQGVQPCHYVVVYDDYSGSFVLLSRCITEGLAAALSTDGFEYDLVWKGGIVAVMKEFTDIVVEAIAAQYGVEDRH